MKICPYCGEEIQDLAKKCRYCGEWINKKIEENNFEDKDNINSKQKKGIKSTILIIGLVIIGIIICYIILNQFNKKESWQGFYYADVLEDGKEIGGPMFDNYEACKDWAIKKYFIGQDAFCSSNCHNSVDGTPICEKVIRTWHPLPGFGEVFDGIDEIIGKKETECKEKRKGFNDIIESAWDDYDAYHECEVDVYYSETYKSCIGESACNAGGMWMYSVNDLDKKEILYSCTEPGDDDCEGNLEEIHNVLK